MRRPLNYHARVVPEEQPFQTVSDIVEYAYHRNKTNSRFEIENDVLQTKGALQATALSLRLRFALLVDFVPLMENGRARGVEQVVNKSHQFIHVAAENHRPAQQVEGYIFQIQPLALERAHSPSFAVGDEHLERAQTLIIKVREFCGNSPDRTQGFAEEIDNAERMVNGGIFYPAVTSEKRMAVITAMASEFRRMGHWYYCPN